MPYDLDPELYKILRRKKLEDIKEPTLDKLFERARKQMFSPKPIHVLGETQAGEFLLSEEEREAHLHIIGSPGQGKSKFIQKLIQDDIDNGYGACLLDPSERADTLYKVLRYCCKKGIKKVCLIDPHHRFSQKDKERPSWDAVIPCINPLHYGESTSSNVEDIMDVIRTVWGQTDWTVTAKIETYLASLLSVLKRSGSTLQDLRYFLRFDHPFFVNAREQILNRTKEGTDELLIHPLDNDRLSVEEIFESKLTFRNDFLSSTRRFGPLLESTMQLIFGSKSALDFKELIRDNWVILVNLDPKRVFSKIHQRLLGTIIINEVIHAAEELVYLGRQNSKFQGFPYNLYIDEVGQYALPKLTELLDYRRKTGLRLIVAHQRFDQIKDKDLYSAIYGGSIRSHALFYTQNPDDSRKMINLMYGGKINKEEVQYRLMELRKQHAVVKIEKRPPETVKFVDVPDNSDVTPEELAEYIQKLYLSSEGHHHPSDIYKEINARFTSPQPGGGIGKTSKRKGSTGSSKSREVSNNIPSGTTVLRRAQRRNAGSTTVHDDGKRKKETD